MFKYDPLGKYLKQLPAKTKQITLTFKRIEEIIGQPMEHSASIYFRSWDNTEGMSGVRQNSWLNVNWETIMVDMEHKKVKFQRKETSKGGIRT
jgi:hypothetical protein